MSPIPKIPARFRPRGLTFLYEDRDLIVIEKEAGLLTADMIREEGHTAFAAVNNYLRKGESRSNRHAWLVHRLDRETSGVLIFAKSEEAMNRLKDNWSNNEKLYLAVLVGSPKSKQGILESYLAEDRNYFVHSVRDPQAGKLSRTRYTVIGEGRGVSLVKIRLLTGRKNQIRVHFSEAGYPVLGDRKYGDRRDRAPRLFLHAKSIAFDHPFSGERMCFETAVPPPFSRLFPKFTDEDWRKK